MYNIVIVEDEKVFSEQLTAYMERYQKESGQLFQVECFSSIAQMRQAYDSRYQEIDVLFLDIELPGGNGIEFAAWLRGEGFSNYILFLTSHTEYVFQGYEVRAFNFLVKPVSYEQIYHNLQIVLKMLSKECYVYVDRGNYIKIPYREIILFSSSGHNIDIVTKEQTFRQNSTLKKVQEKLPDGFYQCHRTAIVNLAHVMKLCGRTLSLASGAEIPVSRNYLSGLQKRLAEFYKDI